MGNGISSSLNKIPKVRNDNLKLYLMLNQEQLQGVPRNMTVGK